MAPRILGTAALPVLLFAIQPASAHSLKVLEDQLIGHEPFVEFVDRPAPGFTLKDADGRVIGLSDYRGKVVVLWFVYANCPDVCPLQSEKLASIQAKVNRTPMRDIVEFLTVTTDPARDTSEILKTYGKAHGLDPANWVFLTSGADKPSATREIAERYGLKFTAQADGEFMHGVVTHVLDKSGNLRARFHGLRFGETDLILYVNALTNDNH